MYLCCFASLLKVLIRLGCMSSEASWKLMKVFAVLESFWKAKLEFLSIGRKSWKVWGRLGSTYAFLRASVPQTYPSHLNKNFISKLQTIQTSMTHVFVEFLFVKLTSHFRILWPRFFLFWRDMTPKEYKYRQSEYYSAGKCYLCIFIPT